jgi:hypothetical protein
MSTRGVRLEEVVGFGFADRLCSGNVCSVNHEETTPDHWSHPSHSPSVSGSSPPPPPPRSNSSSRREAGNGTNGANGSGRTLSSGIPSNRSSISRAARTTSTQRVAVAPVPVEPLALDTGAYEPIPDADSWESLAPDEPGSADMAKLILPPPPPMFSNVRRGEQLLPERSHDPTYYPGLVNDPEPEPAPPRKWPGWANYAVGGLAIFIAGLIARGTLFGPSTWSAVIDVTPSDARVSVDGQSLEGSGTPRTREGLIAGEHTLLVEQAGYVSKREVFSVSGTDRRVVVSLDREPKPEEKAIEPEPVAAVAAAEPAVAEPTLDSAAPTAGAPEDAHLSKRELAKQKRSELRAARIAERYHSRKTDAADSGKVGKHSAEKSEPAAKAGAVGLLKLNSIPWSDVTVDRKLVGHTPLLGLQLRAGKHLIELKNPDSGLRKKLRVQIHAGETVTKVEKLGK